MASTDFDRIERNVRKMIDLGAPAADVDSYLAEERYTPELFRAAMLERKAPPRDLGRSAALGTRNVAEGLAAFPGIAYDVARLPVNALIYGANALGADLPYAKPAAENVTTVLDAAGLPQPQTPVERVTGRVIQGGAAALTGVGAGRALASAPGVVGDIGTVLAAQPASQIVGGGTGGLAGGAAHEAGAGPVAEFMASLGGGAAGAGATSATQAGGRAAAAAVEPFSHGGRERIAASTLLQASADPETLAARVAAGTADASRRLPGSPVTTAQAARDPGLMVLEQGARTDAVRLPGQGGASSAATLRDLEAQRNAARLAALKEGTEGTVEGAGATVRGALDKSHKAAKGEVRALYKSIEADGPAAIPSQPFADAAATIAAKKYGEGSGGIPAELQAVVNDIRTVGGRAAPNQYNALIVNDPVMTVDFLQNIRARLGSIAGKAAGANDERLASTAREMRAAIDDVAEDAATMGKGLGPEQLAQWKAATTARREMGATFGRDETGAATVGRILKRDQFNRPMIPDERVANMALASPGSLRQTLKAAGAEAPDVRKALQGQFARNALDSSLTTGQVADAAGNVTRAVSPAGFIRFMDENGAVAAELFTKQELARFRQLAADFTETQTAATTARARGSDTAQNLSVGNLIARASNGLIDSSNPLAQTVAGFGPVMRWIYAAPEAATREMIVEAIANPLVAEALLAKATPGTVARAAFYLNKSLPERLAEATRGAAGRQGIRTSGALAIPPPE